MSAYRIASIVFFAAIGLHFLFDLGRVTELVAGVAALVAGALLLFTAEKR